MSNKQPNTKTQGSWQRKLITALVAVVFACLPLQAANAFVTDTVTATGSIGATIIKDTATANVGMVPAAPAMTVAKIGTLNDGGDGNADPGDFITYSFTIKNTGNITLQNVSILDPSAVLTGAPIISLAPGAIDTLSFTAKHILTSADVAAGTFTNTAVATAHAASGTDITAGTFATTTLNFTSAMTFSKSGVLDMGGNGRADAGDHITYTFTVKNTGPSPLHNVKVSDPLVNFGSLPNSARVVALLDASQQPSDPIATASIIPAVTEEIHRGPASEIDNAAAGAHFDPALTTANLNVVRQLVRMSSETTPLAAGDKIGFVYGLYNTGEVPLTTINVDQPGSLAYGDMLNILAPNSQDSASVMFTRNVMADEIAAGEIIDPAIITAHARGQVLAQQVLTHLPISAIKPYDSFATASITPSSFPILNPDQTTTFTAVYTLTQADVDAGNVHNSATATALNTLDQTLTKTATFDQPLAAAPGVALIKTGIVNLGPDNVASIGDVVTYNFAVTNTGNVTLGNVGVTELPGFTMAGGPILSLAPGITDSATFTATHALTQADLDAGQISNQAKAKGTSPAGVDFIDPSDPISIAGDNPTIVTLAPKPAIALIKTVTSVNDVNNDGRNDAGDTITYGFSVKNTGNQSLTNVIVTDPKITISGAPLATLAPGAIDNGHFTGTYAITLTDMNTGHVDNTARVDGTAPGNVNVFDLSDPGVFTQDAPTITPLVQQPTIGLVKTQSSITDTNNNSVTDAGDVIHYTFTVNNPGNVTLSNLTVIENLAGAAVQGAAISSFVPASIDNTTFKATYTITAADVLAGRVTNQATAKATSPTGAVVTSLSDNTDFTQHNPTITPITVIPSIAVIKSITGITDVDGNGITSAGDKVQYVFQVKNTGNVPLTNVYITDPNATVAGAHIANLPAGNTDSTTFTASHVLTPTDIINGNVTNQATALGTAPSGAVVTDLSDGVSFTANNPTVATFANAPKIALLKTVSSITDTNSNGITDAGDVIHYQLTITNVGNIPLISITVTDNNGVVTGGPLASLGVLLSDSTTFTATHAITQADINAGSVANQATVHSFTMQTSGETADPSDPLSNTGNAPTIYAIAQTPGIALLKTVSVIDDNNSNGLNDVNDVIHYKFTVVNTGNVPLTNVTLTDLNATTLLPNPAVLPALAAGATDTLTFTATHTITLADGNAGQVSNTATVTATPPVGPNISDISDPASLTGGAPTVTPVTISKPILTKTANISEVKRGMPVLYTITASNLGAGPFKITDIMPSGFAYLAGSATVNTASATPIINARNLDFNNITPVSGKITLKLRLLASTAMGGGQFVNNARLIDQATSNVIATAQATVTIQYETVFDCSDIIGRVFDDQNANGYMDEGEPGLPGVRIVTLNGLLITTDSQGRYHVPCAAVPDPSIGSNYLLKLDERTLPTGYKVTTENPRDVRVTRGKVVKLNFGASILREVRVDVTGKAFDPNTTDLTSAWASGIDRLITVLEKNRSSLLIVYHRGGDAEDLAQARVKAIDETVNQAWSTGDEGYHLVTTTRVEDGK